MSHWSHHLRATSVSFRKRLTSHTMFWMGRCRRKAAAASLTPFSCDILCCMTRAAESSSGLSSCVKALASESIVTR